jgi:hypothetical protein
MGTIGKRDGTELKVHRRISAFTARRRVLAVAVAVGAAMSMVAAPAPATPAPAPAPAIPASAAGADQVTFSPTGFMGPNGEFSEDPPEIFCAITAVYPGIEGVNLVSGAGITSCSWVVNEIAQTAELTLGGTVMSSTYVQKFGEGYAEAHVYGTCQEGWYRTDTEATIYAPAGYYPEVALIHDQSNLVTIDVNRCLGNDGGGGGGGGGDPHCPVACILEGGDVVRR